LIDDRDQLIQDAISTGVHGETGVMSGLFLYTAKMAGDMMLAPFFNHTDVPHGTPA
jgi:hypothetical protein